MSTGVPQGRVRWAHTRSFWVSRLPEQASGPPALYFGQDRLLFVERALRRGTAHS